MFNCLRDYLWVLNAFLRGKILRDKDYRPQDIGVLRAFCLPVPVTTKRISMLMRWWGLRLPTRDEIKVAIEQARQDEHPYTPFITKDGDRWNPRHSNWSTSCRKIIP